MIAHMRKKNNNIKIRCEFNKDSFTRKEISLALEAAAALIELGHDGGEIPIGNEDYMSWKIYPKLIRGV